LMPAVAKAREAASRMRGQNNLKQLAIAFHNYNSAYDTFPQAIYSKDKKKALLSWRVALLPYVEQNELYKQFKLDEPWDSETNKKLAEKMPKVYAPVRGKAEKNTTFYTMFAGEGAALNPKKKRRITNFTDGTCNT